jgi:predicted MFS family arabinose efflux permease
VLPKSLGPDFTKLWIASTVSNAGDGVTLAAGPLLLASLTSDPALIAGAVFVQQLPWLLFSLLSGAAVDRVDRRRLVVVVDLARGLVIAGLAGAVWAGAGSIAVVYAALFLLGTGKTLADNASNALIPDVVAEGDLPRANARLVTVFLLGNQLGGPPLGAYLFAAVAALPFGLDAASFVVAAALIASTRTAPIKSAPAEKRPLRAEIGEGLRWLWRHRVLRMLALSLCLMNLTLTGTMAIYVLYARERLGLGEAGFGLLLSATAIGGIPGSALASSLVNRWGATTLMRVGLVIETLTHLSLAVARSAWHAGVTLVLFGVHAVVWSVITRSVRQREVPADLRGRVNSVYLLLSIGGSALGALAGGVVARDLGVTAPFWMAFGLMALLTTVAWKGFGAVDQTTKAGRSAWS